MRPHVVLVGLALCVFALPAGAQQLEFGARSTVGWTDNLFGGAGNEESDYTLRITPRMQAQDPQGEWTWRFAYRPTWEYYLEFNDLSGWDHDVEGEVEWRARPTTRFRVFDRFSRFQSVASFNEVALADTGESVVENVGQRNRFKRNTFEFEVAENLAPQRLLELRFGWLSNDFSNDRSDRENLGVTVRLLETLSLRNTVGATVGWRRQIFDAVAGLDERETDYYTATGVWQHRFDETFDVFASVGPAWVEPRTSQAIPDAPATVLRFPVRTVQGRPVALAAASCDRLDDGTPFVSEVCEPLVTPFGRVTPLNSFVDVPFDTTDAEASGRLTFFADVSLTKRWETWSLRLGYRRQEDDAGGVGFSSIADLATAQLGWTPSPRWSFQLIAAWLRQTQSTESFAPVLAVRSGELDAFVFNGVLINLINPVSGAAESVAIRGVEVDDDFERTQITLRFLAKYRVTKRWSFVGNVFYLDSDSNRDLGTTREISRFQIGLGVLYEFEPIRL